MKVQSFFSTVHPDDRDMVANMLKEAYEDHQPHDIQHRVKRKNGEIRHVRQRSITILNDAGTPTRIIGTVQDITDFVEATTALASRAKELEMLNRSMVNRELKMIDLKKEIAKLKAQLKT